MKCPKCNFKQLEFDDTIHEEDDNYNAQRIEEWITFCPKCNAQYIVKEIYTRTSQEIVEEIKED